MKVAAEYEILRPTSRPAVNHARLVTAGLVDVANLPVAPWRFQRSAAPQWPYGASLLRLIEAKTFKCLYLDNTLEPTVSAPWFSLHDLCFSVPLPDR
jgi:hypothetical protein